MTAARRMTRHVFSSLLEFLYCVCRVRFAAAARSSRREGGNVGAKTRMRLWRERRACSAVWRRRRSWGLQRREWMVLTWESYMVSATVGTRRGRRCGISNPLFFIFYEWFSGLSVSVLPLISFAMPGARGLVTRRLLCAALCSGAETVPGDFRWRGGWA